MAMIKLPEGTGFSIIPEGRYIFRIYQVDYDPDFGKMEIKMVTADGQTVTERYRLLNKDGEPVQGAYNAFAYFARTALKNFDINEIDHTDLIGCYIGAEVTHVTAPSTKEEGKTVTFVNLGDKWQETEFNKEPCAKTKSLFAKPEDLVEDDDTDLDDLLASLEGE